MRYLKLVGSVCLMALLAAAWRLHPSVAAAYTEDPDPISFQLGGGDYAFERTPLEPSPFMIDVAAPDLRGAPVPVVSSAREPGPAVQMGGGAAGLAGVVVGPDGPVSGAVVHIERHTSSGSAQMQVVTEEDGTWTADGLAGGRFRVRAYLPNVLADLEPQVFFLRTDEQRPLSSRLVGPADSLVVNFHASGPHYLGATSTDAVTVGRELVDGEGRLVLSPVPGHGVALTVTGAAEFTDLHPGLTDGSGALRFSVVCSVLGTSELRASVQPLGAVSDPSQPGLDLPGDALPGTSAAFTFALPDCQEIPPPPTVPDDPGTTVTTVAGSD